MKTQSLKNLLLSLPFAFTLSSALQADDHHAHTISYKTTDISSNIKMLQGKGGNIGVLTGEQGIVLIDDDYGVMSSALTSALSAFGGTEKLTYIINTHWHGDHTEGNKTLGKYAPIVAHENVRQRLLTRQEVKLFGMVSEPYPTAALPSLTYSKTMSLYINDEHLQIIHLPRGHTDGDSIVYFEKANVIHMGDHLFNGFFPFVDVENGGDVLTMAANLEIILPLINDNTVIIPGHGPLANKADVTAFIDMLRATTTEVQAMKNDGLSLADIQKQGLSARWDDWTDGFLSSEQWIEIIYSTL